MIQRTAKAMTFKELKRLVAQGEGQHIEFKRKVYYPQKIMREVVAFANSEGGKLCIGVSDDGQIPGLKHPDDHLFLMQRAIEKFAKPEIAYRLYRIPIPYQSEREVLVFDIPAAKQKPVFLIYNLRTSRGRAYVRVADKSLQASREMRYIMKASLNSEGTLLQYGDAEQHLLRYLGSHSYIDVPKYAEVANISLNEASQILVRMTLAQILEIIPQEGGTDRFIQISVD
ncbi:MAG: ATP-binding protein [Bernardetiaceae bacterium]|nr:ATP-binding protein [Bernardetiaceae bacterium]